MHVADRNKWLIGCVVVGFGFFSFNWGFSNCNWILLKETLSFKKLIWLILFSMKFIFLEIGLVENKM